MEKVFFQDKLNERRKFRASSFYRSLREIVTRAFEKKKYFIFTRRRQRIKSKEMGGGGKDVVSH